MLTLLSELVNTRTSSRASLFIRSRSFFLHGWRFPDWQEQSCAQRAVSRRQCNQVYNSQVKRSLLASYTTIKSKVPYLPSFPQQVFSSMESANNTFDCHSWSQGVPIYRKTSERLPPTPTSQGTDAASWSQSVPKYRKTSQISPTSSGPQDTGPVNRNISPPSPRPINILESQTLSDHQNPLMEFLPYPNGTLLVAFTVMVVAVILVLVLNGVVHATTAHNHSSEDCRWILNSASSLERFPLPYSIDLRAHEDILRLKEPPNLDSLTSLTRTYSDVCSSLATTAQVLIRYISDATEVYRSLPRAYTSDTFYNDTLFVSEQLRNTTSYVNRFSEVYDILEKDYDALMKSAKKVFNPSQLSLKANLLVYAEPKGLVQRLGLFDAHAAYLTPLMESNKRKAASGVAALMWERQRVVGIQQVVEEVQHALQLLASAVQNTNNSHRHSRKPEKGREAIRKQMKDWYEQHIIENRKLKESWSELLASMDRGEKEEVLEIQISPEWCR